MNLPKIAQFNLAFARNVSYKMKSKHWKPEFKYLRAKKYLKVDLVDPDVLFDRTKPTPEEIRSEMKRMGIMTHRPYFEKPISINSTNGVMDPYIPPEGDGIAQTLKGKVKDQTKDVYIKGKSMLDVQKIKRIDSGFKLRAFPTLAQEIYIAAHKALAEFDEKLLHEYVTEKAFVDMTHGLKYCTISWDFIESIEPPRVVHARVFANDTTKKSGPPDFGQITVRFYTRQRLSIYDRFGRLMYGNRMPVIATLPPFGTESFLPSNDIYNPLGPDSLKDLSPLNEQSLLNNNPATLDPLPSMQQSAVDLHLNLTNTNASEHFHNGSVPRDVLEYVVFENHLIDAYGKWRLHAKIIPPWMLNISQNTTDNQVIRTFNESLL